MEALRTHPNEKLLCTARTHMVADRENGHAHSSDGNPDVRLPWLCAIDMGWRGDQPC
jgi:hypothetical protein